MNIVDELRAMRQHTLENPKHGLNCSCKDGNLRRIRIMLRDDLLFQELAYVARVMSMSYEDNVSCTQCYDKKQYWTEWSDAANRDPYLMSLVIEPATDEPWALIHCPSCYTPPRPCNHYNECTGNHFTRTSDYWCNHADHCDLEHE